METSIEEENHKLTKLIKIEQDFNSQVLKKLSKEKTADLIYLNSLLAAEKARSAYFENVITLKDSNEELDINSVQLRLSVESSEDLSNFPFNPIETSAFQRLSLPINLQPNRSLTERFSLNINQQQLDLRSKIRTLEHKLEILIEKLDDSGISLYKEQRKNEELTDLIFTLEEKLIARKLQYENMKKELKEVETDFEALKKTRNENEEMIKKITFEELERVRTCLNSEREKFKIFDEEKSSQIEKLEDIVISLEKKCKELKNENKKISQEFFKANQEIEEIKEKSLKAKFKLIKNFEIEKNELEKEYRLKNDELKMQLTKYEQMQDYNSCSEYTDNELLELEDCAQYLKSDPCPFTEIDQIHKPFYCSLEILDSANTIDESSCSNISQLKTNSTCQTEIEIVEKSEYNTLLGLKESMFNLLNETRSSLQEIESMKDYFFFYINSMFSALSLPQMLPNLSNKKNEEIAELNKTKLFELIYSKNPESININSNISREKNNKFLLFKRRYNPIVAKLFA